MEIILPKYHEFLWSSFSYTLQGDRTQVRCLDEINLLQQKNVRPRLAVPFCILHQFFVGLEVFLVCCPHLMFTCFLP